jgi:hypothetical protein
MGDEPNERHAIGKAKRCQEHNNRRTPPRASRKSYLIACVKGDVKQSCSPLFQLTRVLVRFDHVASRIVNANHGIM